VLVLGESTYGNTAPFHVYVPRWCADKERDRTFSCIFGAFPGLKSTSASVMQREAFWAGIAFANFVEPPVGEKADARPTLEHYRKAATLLPDLLKFLKPCVVLILGKGQGKFSAPVITRANIPYVISPHPSRAKKAELQAAWRQVRYWCLRLVTKKP